MKLPLPLAKVIETALNTVADLDPDSKSRLANIQGQVIKLQLEGPGLDIFLFIHADAIEVMSDFDGEIDTIIAGRPAAMMAMRTSNKGLFSGEVEISGNVETGKNFKRYLDQLEIDWEEQLSQVVGDSVAYQVGSLFRNLSAYVQKSQHAVQQNVGEYLIEEAEYLTPRSEVEHFAEDVDTLRESYDRLAARVNALEKQQEQKA